MPAAARGHTLELTAPFLGFFADQVETSRAPSTM